MKMETKTVNCKNHSVIKGNGSATYRQVQYFELLGGIVNCATSQITRRIHKMVMSELIQEQKNGCQVIIDY